MDTRAIKKAVKLAGGQAKLAKAIGVSQAAVSKWCLGKNPVGVDYCEAIAKHVGNKVRPRDLRPDMARLFAAQPAQTKAA